MHIINAERLAAIVDSAATRTIGVGEGVALRQEVTLLVQRTKRFVADLMVDQHKFAEVGTSAVLDDGLPAARGRRGIARTQGLQIARTARFHHECAEESHDRQFAIVTEGVELSDALLRARRNAAVR